MPQTTREDPAAPALPPGLVYVSDEAPGISRRRQGRGFAYRRADGSALRDPAQLQRIRQLAIPPAYREVWICALPHGHLQATGRDARGRKQYRYHAQWRLQRDADKFDRMLAFAAALPRIRRRVRRDLRAAVDTPNARDAVLAALVRLLDTTMLRVGNEAYARSNGSFGLSTLRQRHAQLKGAQLRLSFRGKSGVPRSVTVDDPAVARVVRHCQALPGLELFQYVDDDGQTRSIGSADVNDYLREASGGEFTAKDFRTWHGSVHALELALANRADGPHPPASARQLLAQVASLLGNTVAVCRKSYVHPRVLTLMAQPVTDSDCVVAEPRRTAGLRQSERRFVAFLGSGDAVSAARP